MNRLEQELAGELVVLRLGLYSAAAGELRGRWQLRVTPTYILFDGAGREVWRGLRAPEAAAVRGLLDTQ